jgi:4-amino-4-deoxychorismate lyase
MAAAVLVNGQPPGQLAGAIACDDRGLNYGDGLFETTVLRGGAVRFLQAHLQRLRESCERLRIEYPGDESLLADIRSIGAAQADGVVKIVVTRGSGGRGYRPDADMRSTRIVTLQPLPAANPNAGIAARWCDTRLSRNPALAGMKHLNRLEQVLAQLEWSAAAIGEGLMLDTEGELVCGTASNVFIGRGDALFTPDLRYCGVRGVMRGQVLRAAQELGIAVSQEPLWPRDLDDATEVFVTNAVRGIRSITALDTLRWEAGTLARRLTAALEL